VRAYNTDEIKSVKSIGKQCYEEIDQYFLENYPEASDNGSFKASELEDPEIIAFLERAATKSIDLLDFDAILVSKLKRANILTIKDLLMADLYKLRKQAHLGDNGAKVVSKVCSDIVAKRDAYLEGDEYGLLINRKTYTDRDFDMVTIEKLRADYGLSVVMLAEWFGISRQRAYQKINHEGPIKDKWVGKEMSALDKAAIERLIGGKRDQIELQDNKYYLLTGKENNAVICVNDKEVKCFFT
jgi:hypothetical protein